VIEVAPYAFGGPRALAILDAALHVGACTRGELDAVIREHKGRRGIVKVRELLGYADGRAESPMEKRGPTGVHRQPAAYAELQYRIADCYGESGASTSAWPKAKVVRGIRQYRMAHRPRCPAARPAENRPDCRNADGQRFPMTVSGHPTRIRSDLSRASNSHFQLAEQTQKPKHATACRGPLRPARHE